MFNGIILRKDDNGSTKASVEAIQRADLPTGDVEIEVAHSTLNYKDALAITGKGPVVRQWPMVPGIDLAGTVVSSDATAVSEGSQVIVNGHGMGELHWGGLAQRARIPAEWVTPMPAGMTTYDAMAIGTAGYTAMLSVLALERHGVKAGSGPILVTGANGGVGSFALALLAGRGYEVVAATGRMEEAERLRAMGATDVIDRHELAEKGKPLQKERWAGAVDCVGSHTLANICAQARYGAVVTACGLAQGMDFTSTVAPFILRGVTLAGIDSVYAPRALREEAWRCLAAETDAATRSRIASSMGLGDVIPTAYALLEGRVKGRVVVDVSA
ncbi:MAG TPA: MDR family oxidoreductase [Burkholderiaceae bacterium]|nr:MDR family oxidoreductase [Burkholderiaceae bacterium]